MKNAFSKLTLGLYDAVTYYQHQLRLHKYVISFVMQK